MCVYEHVCVRCARACAHYTRARALRARAHYAHIMRAMAVRWHVVMCCVCVLAPLLYCI